MTNKHIQIKKALSSACSAEFLDYGDKVDGFGKRIEVHINRTDTPYFAELVFNEDELMNLRNAIDGYLSEALKRDLK